MNHISHAQTLSLVSSKGGVGKSTFAINAACALGDMGLKVLCIDLDSQQSLSKFFKKPSDKQKGIIEFVIHSDLSVIEPTQFNNVSIILNNDANEHLNRWMSETSFSSFALRKLLTSLKTKFDIIIIDTQGKDGRGQLQELALVAADTVIVPTTPDMMSTQELPRSVNIYKHVVNGLTSIGLASEQPPALRILINREDHTVETRTVTAMIREKFGAIARHISVLQTAIPQRVVWRNCISHKKPAHRIECSREDARNALPILEKVLHELLPHYADLSLHVDGTNINGGGHEQ